MVVTVEIEVVMTIVFGQRESIFLLRVNVDKGISIIKIDVSNGRNHHTARLGTLDSLCAVVG